MPICTPPGTPRGKNPSSTGRSQVAAAKGVLRRILACVVASSVTAAGGSLIAHAQEDTMAFTLTSPAFVHRAAIPQSHTCDGADTSPPLAWTEPPNETRSLALIVDDPDAPVGTWVHWVLYNLPPTTRALPAHLPTVERLPDGSHQGVNDFRRMGYGGPCPPAGPAHRYFFKLYALDIALDLPPKATKAQLERAMTGHLLAHAELIGLYQR